MDDFYDKLNKRFPTNSIHINQVKNGEYDQLLEAAKKLGYKNVAEALANINLNELKRHKKRK